MTASASTSSSSSACPLSAARFTRRGTSSICTAAPGDQPLQSAADVHGPPSRDADRQGFWGRHPRAARPAQLDCQRNQAGQPHPGRQGGIRHGRRKRRARPCIQVEPGVNEFVADIVHNLPPFPGVVDSLDKIGTKADALVVSATPIEALSREWIEHGIDNKVALIAGQEMGSKVEHLTLAAKGKYPDDRILMVGDAPGDHKAAEAVGALFFPIVPGDEPASWATFLNEGLDRFFAGTYAGAYQESLMKRFLAVLPENPPWQTA